MPLKVTLFQQMNKTIKFKKYFINPKKKLHVETHGLKNKFL